MLGLGLGSGLGLGQHRMFAKVKLSGLQMASSTTNNCNPLTELGLGLGNCLNELDEVSRRGVRSTKPDVNEDGLERTVRGCTGAE